MTAIQKDVRIGNCRLILGDCLEVMPLLGEFDAVVTDPPYGVKLGEARNGQAFRKNQQKYNLFDDTADYVTKVCVPAVNHCIDISRSVVVTTGKTNMFSYPNPDDFGVWWNPAGRGIGSWGFQCVQAPILYYGKDPRAGKTLSHSSPLNTSASREIKGVNHPCPKPLSLMKWLVNKVSLDGESVLDPFMGSGSTLIACTLLGRHGVGIEIDPEYFEVACERVRRAHDQPDLFIETDEGSETQLDMIGGAE